MFQHNFKYAIKLLFRAKTSLFWTLIFPIVLVTFMYASFGNAFEKTEVFTHIDVAVTGDTSESNALMQILKILSTGDNALLNLHKMDPSEASKALEDDKIAGIIRTNDISLVVNQSSYKATILTSILQQFKQKQSIYTDIAISHPDKLQSVLSADLSSQSYFTERATTSGQQNEYYNYFYAIFAMSCLFASFSSVDSISKIQANTSALGIRRSIAPVNKLWVIGSEYCALLLIHFIVELLTLGYMSLLGINFGKNYPAIILVLFFGCLIGLSIGVIIGSISRIGIGGKIGLSVGIGMILSVLADLCASGIKDAIAHTCPIINKINPAALISDSLYSLNVYDHYQRYFTNIAILATEAAVLFIIAYCKIRRVKYASV